MPIDAEPTGFWGVIGAAVIGLGVAAYRMMRTVKADAREDNAIAGYEARLRNAIADYEARLKTERDWATRFAAERLEFSSQLARLSGLYEALEDKVKTLEADKARLECELAKLEADLDAISAVNHHLVEQDAQMRALMEIEGLGDAYRRIARIVQGVGEKCAPARLSGAPSPLESRG